MPRKAPSEINARVVLSIYSHFNRKAGEILMAKNLLLVAMRQHVGADELQSGIDYAVETGWIENTREGFLRLTEAGQRAMAQ